MLWWGFNRSKFRSNFCPCRLRCCRLHTACFIFIFLVQKGKLLTKIQTSILPGLYRYIIPQGHGVLQNRFRCCFYWPRELKGVITWSFLSCSKSLNFCIIIVENILSLTMTLHFLSHLYLSTHKQTGQLFLFQVLTSQDFKLFFKNNGKVFFVITP